MDEKLFYITLHVRSYEMDSFSHVNNAVYLQYLEYARSEYLLQQGLNFLDFQKWNAIPYVVHADITYRSSARVHDEMEICGKITEWKRTSFIMRYEVLNKTTGKIAAVAEMRFAFVNRDEKLVPIPEAFKKAMS